MGLVGSLEDLGLGDILQIVSLSRKSGLLSLGWGEVKGRIFFNDGRVVASISSQLKTNLGKALSQRGLIGPDREDAVDALVNSMPDSARIKESLAEDFNLDADSIEKAIADRIESVVFHFFSWPEGTFSFELQGIDDELAALESPDHAFVLEEGLSPQFLAMEGTRIQDEQKRSRAEAPVGPPLQPFPKPEAPGPAPDLMDTVAGMGASHETGIEEISPNPAPQAGDGEDDFSSVADALAYYEGKGGNESERPLETRPPPPPEPVLEPEPPLPEEAAAPLPVEAPREPVKQEPEKKPVTAAPQLVLVDDDSLFLESVVHHMGGKGFSARTFTEVGAAIEKIQEMVDTGHRPRAVVADLIMPSADGSNTLGGLEVLKKVRAANPAISVYIVSDYENLPARARSEEMGARYFFMKPKSSQLDDDYGSPELVNFISILEGALQSDKAPAAAAAAPETINLGEELRREFGEDVIPISGDGEQVTPSLGLHMLKAMISELNDPGSNGQITLLILRFAAELMNRSVIFLVAKNQLAGLGQFGIAVEGADAQRHVRKIRIPLNEPSIFRESIQKRLPLKKALKGNKWNKYLVENLGGQMPKEVFVAPIIAGGKIAAILYGDNMPDEKPIGDTESLEIFLAQAGLAMEKALLERRLREMDASSDSA